MDTRRQTIINYVLAVIIAGFLLITLFIVFFPQSFIDIGFSHRIQKYQNPVLDKVMIFISWFGYSPGSTITVVTGSLIFLLFKLYREALFVLLTSLAGVVSTIVKIMVNRPRPSADVVRIVLKTEQQSFPSGHVLFYVVYFGFLMVLMYRLKTIPKFIRFVVSILSLLLVFTIPASRIYLGAHWFTDVTGGFLLGLVCLYILSYQYLRQPVKQ